MNADPDAVNAINEFNAKANAKVLADPRDREYARLPILATDCDYEIVRFSGVQGMRL